MIGVLQTTVTRMSSSVLDLLGVFHVREGNVIRLADRPLLIEEACSGIHSLFAVLAGMVFLAIYCRRSFARGLGLLAAAVTWVVLANTLRIVTVVYLAATWQVDVASGWSHEALGLAVFAVALGLTASTDNLFSLVADFRALPEESAQDLIDEPGAQPAAHPPAPPRRSLTTRRPCRPGCRTCAGPYSAHGPSPRPMEPCSWRSRSSSASCFKINGQKRG